MEGIYSLTAVDSADNRAGAEISIDGIAYILKGGELEPDKWHHLCLTYDSAAGEILFYIDGSETASSAASGLVDSFLSSLHIGRKQNYYFKGKLDDVRVYNYALSPGQVMDLYDEADTSG